MNNIYERIRIIYGHSNMAQFTFAAKLGKSESYISRILKGKHDKGKPTAALLNKICHEFGVNPHWLRTGEGAIYEHDLTGVPLAVVNEEFNAYSPSPEAADLVKDMLFAYNHATEDEKDRLFGIVERIKKRIERDREAGGSSKGRALEGISEGEKKESAA